MKFINAFDYMIYRYILQITIVARKRKNNSVRFVVTSRDLLNNDAMWIVIHIVEFLLR